MAADGRYLRTSGCPSSSPSPRKDGEKGLGCLQTLKLDRNDIGWRGGIGAGSLMNERNTTIIRGFAFLLFVGIIGCGAYLAIADKPFGLDLSHKGLSARIDALGPWRGVGIVVLMVLHSFVPFPAEIVAFLAGKHLGLFWGTVYAWSGAMLGAVMAFADTLGAAATFLNLPQGASTTTVESTIKPRMIGCPCAMECRDYFSSVPFAFAGRSPSSRSRRSSSVRMSSTFLPRLAAISAGVFIACRPCSVARTTL